MESAGTGKQRYLRARELFEMARQLPPGNRARFLRAETAGNDELLSLVEGLLANADTDDGFLDRPALQQPGRETPLPPDVDGYPVLRLLGSGGMGVVYACRNRPGHTERELAVKVFRALPGLGLEALFEQEAQLLQRMTHPNLCRYRDSGMTREGAPYLVMDLIHGTHLDAHANEKELDWRKRLLLFSQVLVAVDYIHSRNVAHRDLKPTNVLVTPEGRAKVLDFGIAKDLKPEHKGTGIGPTLSPFAVMTYAYASPEQEQRRTSGYRSDIYALGVLLYELVTGERPYQEEFDRGQMPLVWRQRAARPPAAPSTVAGRRGTLRVPGGAVIDLRRALVGGVDAMILRALQYRPEDRYPTARAMLDDLQRFV